MCSRLKIKLLILMLTFVAGVIGEYAVNDLLPELLNGPVPQAPLVYRNYLVDRSTLGPNRDGVHIEWCDRLQLAGTHKRPFLRLINGGKVPIYYRADDNGAVADAKLTSSKNGADIPITYDPLVVREREVRASDWQSIQLPLPENSEQFEVTILYEYGSSKTPRVIKAVFDGVNDIPIEEK